MEPADFSISGDSVFNNSLEATVKVTADRQAPSDIIVDLILDNSSNFPVPSTSITENWKLESSKRVRLPV